MKMFNKILFILGATLVFQNGVASAKLTKRIIELTDDEEVDNSLEPNVIPQATAVRTFVHFTEKPPLTATHIASNTVELKCGAMGSPAPTIQWFKNDVPIIEYEIETNRIQEKSVTSLARVSSTLVLTELSENDHDRYTCLVSAGARVLSTSTNVYTVDADADSPAQRQAPVKPRVVLAYHVYMDAIGGDVVVPCKATGHPKPMIYWRDNSGDMIHRRNPRMKVLKTGELLIKHLRWSDMGEYTCIAKNAFGKDSTTTFVYPTKVKPADEE